ncbi:hypothetical protein HaLaN_29993 [Haematococcus lacustris]|uniref:Uncharacterized protein n=1 Tax=Haematococcus lacustris TaxID=44745 RepID=A0A6A0AEH0_HAELA|nr:hypothetical protein HaLaN_29993 [Haematococcus lacustris]
MVYGFGDDESPLQETIDLVEDPVKFARIKELLRMQQLVKQTCNTNDPVAHAAATAAEEEELAAAKAEDAD